MADHDIRHASAPRGRAGTACWVLTYLSCHPCGAFGPGSTCRERRHPVELPGEAHEATATAAHAGVLPSATMRPGPRAHGQVGRGGNMALAIPGRCVGGRSDRGAGHGRSPSTSRKSPRMAAPEKQPVAFAAMVPAQDDRRATNGWRAWGAQSLRIRRRARSRPRRIPASPRRAVYTGSRSPLPPGPPPGTRVVPGRAGARPCPSTTGAESDPGSSITSTIAGSTRSAIG